ncbi:MAG: hypothetical protein ABIP79_15890 [Chitinophagaceae bacterium]
MQLGKTGVLLAAAAAALGAYKFYKMTPEQKKKLKTKGKNLLSRTNGNINNLTENKNIPISGFSY